MRSSNRPGPDDASFGAQSRPGGLISGSAPNLNEYRRPKGVPPRVQGVIVTHCRKCSYQLGNIGTTICPECGTNNDPEAHTLKRPQNDSKLRNCPICKYDLSGIKTAMCPECGTVLTRRGLARVASHIQAARYWTMLWVAAGAMFAAAVLLMLVLVLGAKEPWLRVVVFTAIGSIAMMAVVSFFAVFTRVGLVETWAGTLVKPLLIGALMVLVSHTGVVIMIAMGGGGLLILLPFFLQFLTALGLLSWLMDYDTDEAMWIAGLSFVISVGARLILALIW
jgi:hypothetical protein